MKPAHVAYLETIPANQQFPAARCAKLDDRPDIYMYGKTASSGVESMNRANEDARGKNAVDPLNAALVILKKEGTRFIRGQSDAHKLSRFLSSILTPKANAIMDDIFAKCDPSIYRMQMTELPEYYKFVMSKKSTAKREYIVHLPKTASVHGSKFGSCTCGFSRKEGIPCDHMVAIVKKGAVPNITRVELMPFWYTRAQWQLQYPKDMVYNMDVTWSKIKKSAAPNIMMKYCPSWIAANKKGRPKKDARKLGISDYVKEGVSKSKRRRKNPVPLNNDGEDGHENTAHIREFIELQSNVESESKDGLVGKA